ncbi:hypothetical protein RHSIM_Rhsim08G0210200 [Rhododendron simsii]|uniref:Uncharacterized protein n=1 Tax=Rhododendron simsii TaxID=118357 RepID=A0A834GPC6_RHOSS|nr:hypothetical protein RHSIM_Rhsim08G0210200 [Rhododendron simsii]
MDSGFTFPSQLQIGSPYLDWIVNRDDTFRDEIGTDNRSLAKLGMMMKQTTTMMMTMKMRRMTTTMICQETSYDDEGIFEDDANAHSDEMMTTTTMLKQMTQRMTRKMGENKLNLL